MLIVFWTVFSFYPNYAVSSDSAPNNTSKSTTLILGATDSLFKRQHTKINLFGSLNKVEKKKNIRSPNDWGYYDIDVSEPLQYNHKTIWWTSTYRITTPPPSITTAKIFHRDIKREGKTVFPKSVPKNVVKNIKVKKNDLKTNRTALTNKTLKGRKSKSVRTEIKNKNITETKQLIDKDSGNYYFVINKNNEGKLSILANATNLYIKNTNNETNNRGSLKSGFVINEDISLSAFDYVVIYNQTNRTDDHRDWRNMNDSELPIRIKIEETADLAESINKLDPGEGIIVGPEQSAMLPKVIKDGIFRIEVTTTKNQMKPTTVKINSYNPMLIKNYPNLNSIMKESYSSNKAIENKVNISKDYFLNKISKVTKKNSNLLDVTNRFEVSYPFYTGDFPERIRNINPSLNENPGNPNSYYAGSKNDKNYPSDSGNPYNPGHGPPINPEYGGPINPGHGPPINLEYSGPMNPWRRPPMNTGDGPPINPEYGGPMNPGRGLPFNPEYGGPMNPGHGPPMNPEYGGLMNPGRGPPFNPEFGGPMNPGHGPPMNLEYGSPMNPGYGGTKNSVYSGYGGPKIPGYGSPINQDFKGQMNPGYGAPKNLGYGGPMPPGFNPDMMAPPSAYGKERQGMEIPPTVQIAEEAQTTPAPVVGANIPTPAPMVEETEATTELVRKTTSYKPISTIRPVKDYFDEPIVLERDLSPFVKQLMKDMEEMHAGFFSVFLIKLFESIAVKDDISVRKLLMGAEKESEILMYQESLLKFVGEPFESSFLNFARALNVMAPDAAKGIAAQLHNMMLHRREGITLDVNSVIDYIDQLYEVYEGVELLKAAEIIHNYPKGDPTYPQVHRITSKALYAPLQRLSTAPERQILFDSLNKLIELHSGNPQIPARKYFDTNKKRIKYKTGQGRPYFKTGNDSSDKEDNNPKPFLKDQFRFNVVHRKFNDTKRETTQKVTARNTVLKSAATFEGKIWKRNTRLGKHKRKRKFNVGQRKKINMPENTHLLDDTRLLDDKTGNDNSYKEDNNPKPFLKDQFRFNVVHRKFNDTKRETTRKVTARNTVLKSAATFAGNIGNRNTRFGKHKRKRKFNIGQRKKFSMPENTHLLDDTPLIITANTTQNIPSKELETTPTPENNIEGKDGQIGSKSKIPEFTLNSDKERNKQKAFTSGKKSFQNSYQSSFTFPRLATQNVEVFEKDVINTITTEVINTEAASKPFIPVISKSSVFDENFKKAEQKREEKNDSVASEHSQSDHKHKKHPRIHLSKKEIRHLKKQYRELYKKYIKHRKKSQHKRKHERQSYKHKERERAFSRNKHKHIHKNLKQYKKLKHNYDYVLRSHTLGKTNDYSEYGKSDNEIEDAATHQADNIREVQPETTPITKNIDFRSNSNKLRASQVLKTDWVPYRSPTKTAVKNFRSNKDFDRVKAETKTAFKKMTELSSYSDEEEALRFNIDDTLRHDQLYLQPLRRTNTIETTTKKRFDRYSSYSSEEVILKSNIYKAVGFQNRYSKNTVSEVLKKGDIGKENRRFVPRSFQSTNEETSYSDNTDNESLSN